jgi:hypothetical protein
MRDIQAIADRVEIEALRGEYTDSVMMHDYDRLASLFTEDGAVRIPHADADAEAVGRDEIRSGIERLQGLYRYRRTANGWKFTERAYEVRYLDDTPPTGSAPTPTAPADATSKKEAA